MIGTCYRYDTAAGGDWLTQLLHATERTERLRTVSVPKAVATFLVAGLVVLTSIGAVLAVALHRTATAEAILDARSLTRLEANSVVGQVLVDEALVPGPAQEALDRVVRQHVLGSRVVRVKIWDATGRIVYSDDTELVGRRFPLEGDELEVLRTGGDSAEVSNLTRSENTGETQFGKLLQVYLGVRTPGGQRLLFETYQPYEVITAASRRTWLTSLPVLLGGLVLLYLVQAPLAYRMARRLKRSQDEREALLLASLAAADRERVTIAADLHDGIVQGLAGASYSLSAAAAKARDRDGDSARAMSSTATDLRRWVRELRSLVVTITPPQLHLQGLAASLRDLAATLEVRGLTVTVEVTGAGHLDETTEALVYRAAQEAVRNIVRHADAGAVWLRVGREDAGRAGPFRPGRGVEALVLRVRDDGRGFETGGTAARGRGSVGLELLSALVISQGGTLTINSAPGKGTEMILRMPADPVAEPPGDSGPPRTVDPARDAELPGSDSVGVLR
jgi:two-component system, NarL family, sensor kinase